MQLNYKKYGESGPNLIILHGLFGMLDNWQTLSKRWSSKFQIWAIDQRNHGRSPHSDEFGYDLMADDLKAFFDTQQLTSAIVLGHSMGGKTAMHFALKYPELLEKLIIVDIAPKAYPPGHEEIFEAFESVKLNQLQNRKEADAMMKSVIKEFGVRQFLLKNLYRRPEGTYHWRANVRGIKAQYQQVIDDMLPPWSSYDGPCLFIKGAKSLRYILEEDTAIIKQFFPLADIQTVQEAGHWVHADQPNILYQLVSDFADS